MFCFQIEERKAGQNAWDAWRKRESSYIFVLIFAIIFSLTSVQFDRVDSLPGGFDVVPFEFTSPENTKYAAFCFENNSIIEKVRCHCRKQWSGGCQSSCPCNLSITTTGSEEQDKFCIENYPQSNGLSRKRDVGCDEMSFIDGKLISPCLPPGDDEIMVNVINIFAYRFDCELRLFEHQLLFQDKISQNRIFLNKQVDKGGKNHSIQVSFRWVARRTLGSKMNFTLLEDELGNRGLFVNDNLIPVEIGSDLLLPPQKLCPENSARANAPDYCDSKNDNDKVPCMEDALFGIHIARGSP